MERIGQGGFATVWRALDLTEKKRPQLVAIKILHPQYSQDKTRRDRFFRGARKMLDLNHDGIVKTFEPKLNEDGYYFYTMEYVKGVNLRQAIEKNTLSLNERLRIIIKIGKALHFAHENGVYHRDIKPDNILLDETNKPKVTDFDLAHAFDTTGGTRTQMMGTVVYAAPEMLEKPQKAGIPADVYGLGMTTIFALYGGNLPSRIIRDPSNIIAQLRVSKKIQKILSKAVAWDSNYRFQSVKEFYNALERASSKPTSNSFIHSGISAIRIIFFLSISLIPIIYILSSIRSIPKLVAFEGEDGMGNGLIMSRSAASWNKTILLKDGETIMFGFKLDIAALYQVSVRYSNDNDGSSEEISILLDNNLIGTLKTTDTGDFGEGWNTFKSDYVGAAYLTSGTHKITLVVSNGDRLGIEIDQIIFKSI